MGADPDEMGILQVRWKRFESSEVASPLRRNLDIKPRACAIDYGWVVGFSFVSGSVIS
jgi:hypothetical protein